MPRLPKHQEYDRTQPLPLPNASSTRRLLRDGRRPAPAADGATSAAHVQPPAHLKGVAFPRDGSPQEPSKKEEGLDAAELAKRQARLQKRGALLRKVLGAGTYVVDEVGDYRRKKVKVYVQYEGFQPGAIDTKRELRVAISLPDSWVDAPE